MGAVPLTLPEEIRRHLVTAQDLTLQRRPASFSAGLPPLDALLHGGLPKGALVEVFGRRSSGRFTLGLHALAAATQAGETAALVDLGDHLDPQAAAREGVDLARLLWLRPRRLKPALLAAETVLSAGFALVVFDLGYAPFKKRDETASHAKGLAAGRTPTSCWLRLARLAVARGAALLVLSPYRVTGPAAGVVLAAESARALWTSHTGGDPLFLGLASRLTLQKRRGEERAAAASPLMLRVEESLKTTRILSRGVDPGRSTACPEPLLRGTRDTSSREDRLPEKRRRVGNG